MNEEEPVESHIRSEQIFGSSRKIQFIGLSKPPLPPQQQQKDQMSIESLLTFSHPRQSQTASTNDITINNLLTCDMKRKWAEPSLSVRKKLKKKSKVVCYYGAVAQKSYGSEKRFLCPPPIVQLKGANKEMELSMSILCEDNDILEQHTALDEHHSGSFRYLHVTGTAKAKQFKLQLNLLQNESSFASFLSKPISIISKPSKKTAKTSRNTSTCILANSPVSLFNRINSQTVRTKYMTCDHNRLCAKNTTWSPFDVIVLCQPKQVVITKQSKSSPRYNTSRLQLPKTPVSYLTYGTEIILRESRTGLSSPPLILCKVDRGRLVESAYGPVSQMQKIALRLASSDPQHPVYLSAAGSMSSEQDTHQTWLDYSPSRKLEQEEIDDYLCWTIVGIHTLEGEFDERQPTTPSSPPPEQPRLVNPYPYLTHLQYKPETNTLEAIGQHLIQAAPVPRLLEPWLGTHGPLPTRIASPPETHTPHEIHWSIDLSSVKQQTEELPLLLVRQDGLVYHTGKSLKWDQEGEGWLYKSKSMGSMDASKDVTSYQFRKNRAEKMISKYLKQLELLELQLAKEPTTSRNETRQAIKQCEDMLTMYYKQLDDVKSVRLMSRSSSQPLSLPESDLMALIPCLQWRQGEDDEMLVDANQEIFPSPTAALQRMAAFLTPHTDWRRLIESGMNRVERDWYRQQTITTWPDFCEQFLTRFGTKHMASVPLEDLLEWVGIRMDPNRETLASYLTRFHQSRQLAGLPDHALSASLLIYSLPVQLRHKVRGRLAAQPQPLTHCAQVETIARRALASIDLAQDRPGPAYVCQRLPVADKPSVGNLHTRVQGQKVHKPNASVYTSIHPPCLSHKCQTPLHNRTNCKKDQDLQHPRPASAAESYLPCVSHQSQASGHHRSNCKMDHELEAKPERASSSPQKKSGIPCSYKCGEVYLPNHLCPNKKYPPPTPILKEDAPNPFF
ncbi:hypothetical protein G6F55_005944 [Rhizopus delemar]|uniref:Uncharacterized protein n=2 Tax=Rhizopus TaxID=4842 RepID=A0A9P6Z088_9FUNG|nr:hypothetical protein G6F55_005944 [Rhizopus delemar]KAG1524626.1 hypothetical protein G6F52_004038 [Rhizopus delemar]KAG1557775.1 hypothetical protein G6F49_005100 [Rhizopus delemar]KAG1567816.1 hypothetical protein G6F50_007861 [Rhizopus delemar]